MTQYLLPAALSLAVLLTWRLYVRTVRLEQHQIIIRFTASARGMTEAMQRMTAATRELHLAWIRAREAGVFDDYSESS